MQWRRLARKGGKWAGVVAALAVIAGGAVTWSESRWCELCGAAISIGRGRVVCSGPQRSTIGDAPLDVIRAYVAETPAQEAVLNRSLRTGWAWPVWKLGTRWAVSIPLWVPLCVMAIPTTLLWRADRRAARREKVGHCPACGYDRRGLTQDAPCPECGKLPTSPR